MDKLFFDLLLSLHVYGSSHSYVYLIVLQELYKESSRFKDELWLGIRDISWKTDLIVFVHNLSHIIPRYNTSNELEQKPVLSLFLDEAKSLGIPWVLAITNKFSVSAHHQKAAIEAVLKAYQASPSTSEVLNSCPYVMASVSEASLSQNVNSEKVNRRIGVHRLIFAPINIIRRPFQRKEIVFPVEGVNSLCQRIHKVLRDYEEASFQVRIFYHRHSMNSRLFSIDNFHFEM